MTPRLICSLVVVLSDQFRIDLLEKARHVRTPEGAKAFDLPIGAPIPPGKGARGGTAWKHLEGKRVHVRRNGVDVGEGHVIVVNRGIAHVQMHSDPPSVVRDFNPRDLTVTGDWDKEQNARRQVQVDLENDIKRRRDERLARIRANRNINKAGKYTESKHKRGQGGKFATKGGQQQGQQQQSGAGGGGGGGGSTKPQPPQTPEGKDVLHRLVKELLKIKDPQKRMQAAAIVRRAVHDFEQGGSRYSGSEQDAVVSDTKKKIRSLGKVRKDDEEVEEPPKRPPYRDWRGRFADRFKRHLIRKVRKVPCSICGRPMSDPKSIALGFGPSHLKQNAPKIKLKVDRLLREKGLTRQEAVRRFGNKDKPGGTVHPFVGEPRDTANQQPARIRGETVPGQAPFKAPAKKAPAAKKAAKKLDLPDASAKPKNRGAEGRKAIADAQKKAPKDRLAEASAKDAAKKAAKAPKKAAKKLPSVPKQPRTSQQPNYVVVELDPGFNDRQALDAFFSNLSDDQGRPLFEQGRGDKIFVEADPQSPAYRSFERRAKELGIEVVNMKQTTHGTGTQMRRDKMIGRVYDQLERDHAAGQFFAFRAAGNDFGQRGDLMRRFLRRGADSRGNVPEVGVIVPGFTGDDNLRVIDVNDLTPGITGAVNLRDRQAPIRPKFGKPKGYWNGHEADTAALAEAEDHFDNNGGEILDAPVEDGVMAYIFKPNGGINDRNGGYGLAPDQLPGEGGYRNPQPDYDAAHPDRFTVKHARGGISPKFWVTDKTTGKRVMLKGSNGFQAHDILNEVLAYNLLDSMGIKAPKTVFANNRGGAGPRWLAMEHVEDTWPGVRGFGENSVSPADISEDPQSMMRLNLFDFLLDNTDRHGGNWMWYEDADGIKHVAIIDNGGAWQGRVAPGGSYINDYQVINKGRSNISTMVAAYVYAAPGHDMDSKKRAARAAIERDYDDMITRLERLNVDAVLAHVGGGKLNPAQEAHLRLVRETLTKRIEHLRTHKAEVVDWWMRMVR